MSAPVATIPFLSVYTPRGSQNYDAPVAGGAYVGQATQRALILLA